MQHRWEKPKSKVTQNGGSEFQLIEHFQQRTISLSRNDRKKSCVRFPKVGDCGKVNTWEETDV